MSDVLTLRHYDDEQDELDRVSEVLARAGWRGSSSLVLPDTPPSSDLVVYDAQMSTPRGDTPIAAMLAHKRMRPESCIGFLTNYPEDVARVVYEVDFVVAKHRLAEERHPAVFGGIMAVHALARLVGLLARPAEDPPDRDVWAESESVLAKLELASRSLADELGWLPEAIEEVRGAALNARTTSGEFAAAARTRFRRLATRCIDGLAAALSEERAVLHLATGQDVLLSEYPISAPASRDPSATTRQVYAAEILDRVRPLGMGDRDLARFKEHLFPLAVEASIMLQQPFHEHQFLTRFAGYRPLHLRWHFTERMQRAEAMRLRAENVVPFALFPSGALELFGRAQQSGADVEVLTDHIEDYFDPTQGLDGATGAEHLAGTGVHNFWLLLAEA